MIFEKPIDVSIIIVNYNTINLLINSIDSILGKTCDVTYEVIVVDNDSQDNSIPILRERYENIPNFYIIESGENLGFGRANNKGLEIAKGRNVFFLNSDTLLLNNAIRRLSIYLDNNPDVGVCGGNLFDENMEPVQSFKRVLPSIFTEINNLALGIVYKFWFKPNLYHNFTKRELLVGYITGADMMVRRDVLDKVGYFNPQFFMYYEETELSYRIHKAGYKIVSIPDAQIIHLEGKSFVFKEQREIMVLHGRSVYNRLVFSHMMIKIIDFLHLVFLYERSILHRFILRNKKIYWSSRLRLFKEYMRKKNN